MIKKRLVVMVAALMAMSACSGTKSAPTASPNPHRVVLGEDAPEDANKSGQARSGKKARATSSPSPHPLDPKITRNPDGTYDIPNAVKAQVPEEESWAGPTCAPPRPGSICWVPFQGSAYSREDNATIVLLAYEDGASSPAASLNVPAKKGDNRIDYSLQYTVGKNPKYVTFQVDLRDQSGKTVAQSFPQQWPLSY